MSIVLVGLNQRTATVDLREQFSVTECGVQVAFAEMGAPIQESVILSTCNRLEVYAVAAGDTRTGWALVEQVLCRMGGTPMETLRPHLYYLDDRSAIEHLMHVAAGIDSTVLGEPQILGQVAQAFADARAGAKVGPILTYLFSQAVHVGKRARAETDISRHTTSVSHAAVLLAEKMVGDLSACRALVAGVGEMAHLAAQALVAHGARDITCINRSFERAQELAQTVGGRALKWHDLDEAIARADVMITATGAPHPVIYADDVAPMLAARLDRPLVIIDIAVPRDVDPSVGGLSGVRLFDIDHLEATLDANMALRQAAIPQVETIVQEDLAAALDWLHSREVVPVIECLRRRSADLAEAELQETLHRLVGLDDREREAVARMAHRIVNKLLHQPTVRLKACAASGNGHGYAHAVRELFDLGEIEKADSHVAGPGPDPNSP